MTITEKPAAIIETHSTSKPPDPEYEKKVLHNQGEDVSTFSRILAIYTRDADTKEIYCINEKMGCDFENNWSYIKNVISSQNCFTRQDNNLDEYLIPACDSNIFEKSLTQQLKITEHHKKGETQIRGCIIKVEISSPFNDWFIYHVLDQARLHLHEKPIKKQKLSSPKYHEIFADFFANNFKNTIKGDEWEKCGRKYFIDKVKYFTDRYIKIECILPAFPCKSSNINKVGGVDPDKGEELALRRLIQITEQARQLYPPGLKIWIVSDGHVFSDCIGVDDDIVDHYTSKLHALYEKCKEEENSDSIGFCGLNDLFFNGISSESFDPTWIKGYHILHYTGTKISSVSDASRQILMKGCDTDDGTLRKDINIPNHPRLHLYRGFSRFMMEDLALLPYFQDHSRKGFKKAIAKIAFNMIKRNDAYSNLVELMFPHHMRISIHAHKNSGPKFGVKVISHEQCSIVRDLQNIDEPTFEDLLHIPTPWHNCVVKVAHGTDVEKENYFLTKSGVIKDAIENGNYKGEWKDTCFVTGNGGCYEIMKFN